MNCVKILSKKPVPRWSLSITAFLRASRFFSCLLYTSTSIDDEGTIACFFSSAIYGTEEAYKKASEAKEELSSWQYERS